MINKFWENYRVRKTNNSRGIEVNELDLQIQAIAKEIIEGEEISESNKYYDFINKYAQGQFPRVDIEAQERRAANAIKIAEIKEQYKDRPAALRFHLSMYSDEDREMEALYNSRGASLSEEAFVAKKYR